MFTLASLQQDITDNYKHIECLLKEKSYNEALTSMEHRLFLIDSLLRLVENDPALRKNVASLAEMLSRQEEILIKVTTNHHQAIFKELSSIGLASKAKQIYSMNSKEF